MFIPLIDYSTNIAIFPHHQSSEAYAQETKVSFRQSNQKSPMSENCSGLLSSSHSNSLCSIWPPQILKSTDRHAIAFWWTRVVFPTINNGTEGGIVEMNNHWPAGDVAGGSKARMFLQRKRLYKFCKNSHGKPSTHGESPMDHGTFSSLPNTAVYRSVYNNPQTCTMYYHVNVLVMSNVLCTK